MLTECIRRCAGHHQVEAIEIMALLLPWTEQLMCGLVPGMRRRAVPAKWSAPSSSGLLFWRHRLKQAIPTCCTKMPATARATSRTWALSSAATCALRLWSTPALTKQPCATWPPLPCLAYVRERTAQVGAILHSQLTMVCCHNVNLMSCSIPQFQASGLAVCACIWE